MDTYRDDFLLSADMEHLLRKGREALEEDKATGEKPFFTDQWLLSLRMKRANAADRAMRLDEEDSCHSK